RSLFWRNDHSACFIDLFVANYRKSLLYRNNGNRSFTRVTSNVSLSANSNGATWADYDNDGFPDLFVFNYNQRNFLFHNNGDGSFTQIKDGPIANDVSLAEGAAWGDYDNDGFLDLLIANRHYELGPDH